jgi:hypothetical protein
MKYYKIYKNLRFIKVSRDIDLLFVKYNMSGVACKCKQDVATHISLDDNIEKLSSIIFEPICKVEYDKIISAEKTASSTYEVSPVSDKKDVNNKTDDIVMEEFVIPQLQLYDYQIKVLSNDSYGITYNNIYMVLEFIHSKDNNMKFVYTLNNRGPFKHNSYEFIVSDIEKEFSYIQNKRQ